MVARCWPTIDFMWMVMIQGGWHVANESVIASWIAAGTVHRHTLVRHESWSSPTALQNVPALATLFPFGDPVLSRAIGSPGTSDQWGVLLKVAAVVMLAGGASVASTGHAGVGPLTCVGVGLVVLLAVVARVWGAMPQVLLAFNGLVWKRKALATAVLAAATLGSVFGMQDRSKRIARCEDALASANAMKKRDRPATDVADAFRTAQTACTEAEQDDEAALAIREGAGAAAKHEREQRLKKEAEFLAKLDEARRASASGQSAAAVASFGDAEKLGALDPADAETYAAQLVAQARTLMSNAAYSEAVQLLEKAQQVATGDARGQADSLINEARGSLQLQEDQAGIELAIAVSNDARCNSTEDIHAAWDAISRIDASRPSYKQAKAVAPKLERCRKKALKQLVDGTRQVMKAQREQWAAEHERALLAEGLNVRVRLGGRTKDRVTIEYVLLDRAWAYKITDGGSMSAGSFLGGLEDLGFRRVTFSDGFYESNYYDLEPESVESAAAIATGLGDPLKL